MKYKIYKFLKMILIVINKMKHSESIINYIANKYKKPPRINKNKIITFSQIMKLAEENKKDLDLIKKQKVINLEPKYNIKLVRDIKRKKKKIAEQTDNDDKENKILRDISLRIKNSKAYSAPNTLKFYSIRPQQEKILKKLENTKSVANKLVKKVELPLSKKDKQIILLNKMKQKYVQLIQQKNALMKILPKRVNNIKTNSLKDKKKDFANIKTQIEHLYPLVLSNNLDEDTKKKNIIKYNKDIINMTTKLFLIRKKLENIDAKQKKILQRIKEIKNIKIENDREKEKR